MSVYRGVVFGLVALFLVAMIGCNKSAPQESIKSAPATSPSDYSARLNSPYTSEQEKEQIRRAQAQSSGGSPAADNSTFARPAPSGAGQ